jgi:hypothetical protein
MGFMHFLTASRCVMLLSVLYAEHDEQALSCSRHSTRCCTALRFGAPQESHSLAAFLI